MDVRFLEAMSVGVSDVVCYVATYIKCLFSIHTCKYTYTLKAVIYSKMGHT